MQFQRLFTQGHSDPYDLIHFRTPQSVGDDFDVPLEHPDGWSVASVELLAEQAAHTHLPPAKNPIEENTVPSWLWRQSRAKCVGKNETSVRHVLDRVVGAAAYQGWKQKIFVKEETARIFFDEARYALAQRFITLEPKYLATLGLSWAYGLNVASPESKIQKMPVVDISNSLIDVVVSGRRERASLAKWQKIIAARTKPATVHIQFSDTESEWETPADTVAGVRINLMAFRHNDGSVNIEALRQAVRIAVVVMDLNDVEAGLAIGMSNLAPLLMALALPYDSEAGRATAAAISAIITAEAYATSAVLAGLRGVSPDFVRHREACLRALRNHRRAAYGEENDYEKISVIPLPLALAACPDLALTAAARSAWDHALDKAQGNGLRHTQVTGFVVSPTLTLLAENDSDGLAPMRSLAKAEMESDLRIVHPSVGEALVRLGYEAKTLQSVVRHIRGALTLEKAPAINHVSLRARGFTADVLAKIEEYLPQAQNLCRVLTPWVVGVDFCRTTLKVPSAKIEDMRFNLLQCLGFKDNDIRAANAWCYGHDGLEVDGLLRSGHYAVFDTAASLHPEAPIRMAAAVQGFVSGETALLLNLPLNLPAEIFEKLLLDAWRRGVKSLTVNFDALTRNNKASPVTDLLKRSARRKGVAPAFLHAKPPVLPKRHMQRSTPRLGVVVHGKTRPRSAVKGDR